MNNQGICFQKILIVLVFIIIIYMGITNIQKTKSQPEQNIETTAVATTTATTTLSKELKVSILGGTKKTPNNISSFDTIKTAGLGADFSVLVQTDGSVLTWGSNDAGQLGRTTKKTEDTAPTQVEGLKDIVQVSTTYKHTLALDKNGDVYAFGSNFTGQIGNGTNIDARTPVKIGIKNIKKVSAGYKFSMAVDDKGDVYVWGASCSQDTQAKALALLNSFGSNVTSLQGGYYDASSVGEGTYDHGEDCLNESTVGIKSKVPKKLEGVKDVVDISVGYGHALMLKKDGTVWSFGCNMYGQLGWDRFNNITNNATPQQIKGLKNIKKIVAGFRSSLAVSEKNTIYYWGINAKIDPKNKNTFNLANPEVLSISHPFKNIDSISSGRDYTLIVLDGVVYGFGNDYLGIVDQNKAFSFYPQKIQSKNNQNIKQVVAGGSYALVLY